MIRIIEDHINVNFEAVKRALGIEKFVMYRSKDDKSYLDSDYTDTETFDPVYYQGHTDLSVDDAKESLENLGYDTTVLKHQNPESLILTLSDWVSLQVLLLNKGEVLIKYLYRNEDQIKKNPIDHSND